MIHVKRLMPRHLRIMDLDLRGIPHKKISEILGLGTTSISIITNSPLYQERIVARRQERERRMDESEADLIAEARDEMQKAALSAARVHVELLDSDEDRVAQASANQILDRVGLVKPVDGSSSPVVVLNTGQLALIQLALKESHGAEAPRSSEALPVVDKADLVIASKASPNEPPAPFEGSVSE